MKFASHHIIKKNDNVLLFITDNCSLFELDSDLYKRLRISNGNIHDDSISFLSDDEKETLTQEGAIVLDENNSIKKTNDEYRNPLNSITLILSNDCNMNCKYCYGDGGTYGRKRELMDEETVLRAIDFLIKNSGKNKNLHISFFGGEPLLNIPVMEKALEYCRLREKEFDKSFTFTMTTNGTILNEKITELIQKHNIGIQISIDGDKTNHDQNRVFANGTGSFDLICENAKKLSKTRKIGARATICRDNIDVQQIFHGISQIGFSIIHMLLADVEKESGLYVQDDDLKELYESYHRFADEYVDLILNNSAVRCYEFEEALKKVFYKHEKQYMCGAGRTAVTVAADGQIYPCHRFLSMEEYMMGSLNDGLSETFVKQFTNASGINKQSCVNCWAKYLCGGGCAFSAAKENASIAIPSERFCDYTKKICELALYIYYKAKCIDEDIFLKRYKQSTK